MSMTPNSDRARRVAALLRRTRREQRQLKWLVRLLVVLLGGCAVLFVASATVSHYGGMTVTVDPTQSERVALMLSETADLAHPTSRLNARAHAHMTNISERDLPTSFEGTGGLHAGQDYLAYTFYVGNCGSLPADVTYEVNITHVTRALDSALRIRLYVNGEPTTYAKPRTADGGAEAGCVSFLSDRVVMREVLAALAPDETAAFTVVMWLEGDDPDCVDALIGGSLKVSVQLSAEEAAHALPDR